MSRLHTPVADRAPWWVLTSVVMDRALGSNNGKETQLIKAEKEFVKEYWAAPRIFREPEKQGMEN